MGIIHYFREKGTDGKPLIFCVISVGLRFLICIVVCFSGVLVGVYPNSERIKGDIKSSYDSLIVSPGDYFFRLNLEGEYYRFLFLINRGVIGERNNLGSAILPYSDLTDLDRQNTGASGEPIFNKIDAGLVLTIPMMGGGKRFDFALIGPLYKKGGLREFSGSLVYSPFSDVFHEKSSMALNGSFSSIKSNMATHGIFVSFVPYIFSLYYYNRGGSLWEMDRGIGRDWFGDEFLPVWGVIINIPEMVYGFVGFHSEFIWEIEYLDGFNINELDSGMVTDSWFFEGPILVGNTLKHGGLRFSVNFEDGSYRFSMGIDTLFSHNSFVHPGLLVYSYANITNSLYELGLLSGFRSYYYLDSLGRWNGDWFKYSGELRVKPCKCLFWDGIISDIYGYPTYVDARFIEHTVKTNYKIGLNIPVKNVFYGNLLLGFGYRKEYDFDRYGTLDTEDSCFFFFGRESDKGKLVFEYDYPTNDLSVNFKVSYGISENEDVLDRLIGISVDSNVSLNLLGSNCISIRGFLRFSLERDGYNLFLKIKLLEPFITVFAKDGIWIAKKEEIAKGEGITKGEALSWKKLFSYIELSIGWSTDG